MPKAYERLTDVTVSVFLVSGGTSELLRTVNEIDAKMLPTTDILSSLIASVKVLLLPYSTFSDCAKALVSEIFHWYLPPARPMASLCLSPVSCSSV